MQVIEVGFSDGNGHYHMLWYDKDEITFEHLDGSKIEPNEFNTNGYLIIGPIIKVIATTADGKEYIVSNKSQHARRD